MPRFVVIVQPEYSTETDYYIVQATDDKQAEAAVMNTGMVDHIISTRQLAPGEHCR